MMFAALLIAVISIVVFGGKQRLKLFTYPQILPIKSMTCAMVF